MNKRDKKHILDKVANLSSTEHDEIFKILSRQNIPHTRNKNGAFFNLSIVPDETLLEIDKFVEYCKKNQVHLDEYDKRINECKLSNNYESLMFAAPSASSEKADSKQELMSILDARTKLNEALSWKNTLAQNEKAQSIANMLEASLEKVQKKNQNTKFINAKKRYSKKIAPDKKIDTDLSCVLQHESYPTLI